MKKGENKMKKVTKTVITHKVTISRVDGNTLIPVKTFECEKLPRSRDLSKLSKELKAQVVITADEPIANKFWMPLDTFLEHAEKMEMTESSQAAFEAEENEEVSA